MLSFVAVAILSSLLLVAALGWFRERDAIQEWDVLLSPEGRRAYLRLRQSWGAEAEVADWSFSTAMAQPDRAERLRLVGASAQFLVGLVPSRLEQVRRLALYSRMVGAMAPLPPLDPREFKLPAVRGIAGLGAFLHCFAVSVGERFRLRLFVLHHGFGALVRSLFRSRRRIERASVDAEWWRIVAAREDFRTLDEETLESCRVLVVALGQIDRSSWAREVRAG